MSETPPSPPEQGPPGEFVSPELRSDCARFLEDIKARARRSPTVPTLPGRAEPE